MNRKAFRRALDILGLVLLLGAAVFAAVRFHAMPDQVPIHYDAAGQIDSYGPKATVFVLPVVGLAVFGFTFFVDLIVANAGSIPAGRADNVRIALAFARLLLAFAFGYITVCVCLSAPLGRRLIPVVYGGLAAAIIGYVLCFLWPRR